MLLAPLNSMAANFGGSTLHSFGEIEFKDRKGQVVNSRRRTEDALPNMTVKCSSLRVLIIDEIEAAGIELLADLEERIQRHAPKTYKYASHSTLPRVWGGINVLLGGDWWQLPPVGQVSIMSNPFQQQVMESARMMHVMIIPFTIGYFMEQVIGYSQSHSNLCLIKIKAA